MKICLISRECFPFTHGGIGTAFYSLGKMLANLNHDVILLTRKPANFNEDIYNQHYTNKFKTEWVEYTEGAFSVHSLLDYSFQLEKHFDHFNNTFQANVAMYAEFDGEAYFLLRNKNKGLKYQNTSFVVHFSGPLFALLEAEKRIPSVYEQLIIKMEAYCIQASSYAIAPSSFILNYLKQQFNLQHQQHFVIPNPINNTIFTEPVPPASVYDNKKNILFIGRLQKTKGVDYLLKAFQQLIESGNEQVRLQLIGRDVFWSDYNMTFQEYCKASLPENILSKIDFIGHISQADMFAYHRQAWIAVFPSRFDTFGNVALECIYNGTPVIVSKNTGLPDVTGEDYNFFWHEENGVGALTTLLQKVLADSALRNELALQSHKRATYLHTHLPGQFVNALQEIIAIGNDQAVEVTAIDEQVFLLLNQYSAIWQQEKNAEIKEVYIQKDEELKKAWESYDNKNNELAAFWHQHDEQIKDVWVKYDEKDKQIQGIWKQYDAKDAVLQELQQRYDKLEQQQNDQQQQYSELQQQYIQFQQSNIDLLQRYNESLKEYNELQQQYNQLQHQYNEMLSPYNQILVQHEKLKQQLSTLNKDIEKYLNSNSSKPFKVVARDNKDFLPEIELLYYQIGLLKKKGRRFF
ncbi:glycosyltransferase family 4 protein [Niastella caeni]|uniref:Glycosyltransferase family 4 protein n=1 Tax=Niastella caeni TaxID=2569763 RepID=A0A4S8HEN6_9BACT|nr:glycosyltransferase family 4 protein [Niastella caeni]THU33530.1 glycosyltransferase family 4 protein [Niastella caeni]